MAIGMLASLNLGISGVARAVDIYDPILHSLLVSGQVIVAFVTALYVWRKAREVNQREARNRVAREQLKEKRLNKSKKGRRYEEIN